MRFGGAVGAAPPVKPAADDIRSLKPTNYGSVRDSSSVRVASEITLRSQRTSSE